MWLMCPVRLNMRTNGHLVTASEISISGRVAPRPRRRSDHVVNGREMVGVPALLARCLSTRMPLSDGESIGPTRERYAGVLEQVVERVALLEETSDATTDVSLHLHDAIDDLEVLSHFVGHALRRDGVPHDDGILADREPVRRAERPLLDPPVVGWSRHREPTGGVLIKRHHTAASTHEPAQRRHRAHPRAWCVLAFLRDLLRLERDPKWPRKLSTLELQRLLDAFGVDAIL